MGTHMDYFTPYQRLLDIYRQCGHAADIMAVVTRAVTAAADYVAAECERYHGTVLASKAGTTDAYDLPEQAELRRNAAFVILVDALRQLPRLLRMEMDKVPRGGLYTGDPRHLENMEENREAIGEWALALVLALNKRPEPQISPRNWW